MEQTIAEKSMVMMLHLTQIAVIYQVNDLQFVLKRKVKLLFMGKSEQLEI